MKLEYLFPNKDNEDELRNKNVSDIVNSAVLTTSEQKLLVKKYHDYILDTEAWIVIFDIDSKYLNAARLLS